MCIHGHRTFQVGIPMFPFVAARHILLARQKVRGKMVHCTFVLVGSRSSSHVSSPPSPALLFTPTTSTMEHYYKSDARIRTSTLSMNALLHAQSDPVNTFERIDRPTNFEIYKVTSGFPMILLPNYTRLPEKALLDGVPITNTMTNS